jgi:hypothetical protein
VDKPTGLEDDDEDFVAFQTTNKNRFQLRSSSTMLKQLLNGIIEDRSVRRALENLG